ncbi:hypothetical protein [Maricaulis maris]|jgi:hypothetical protein|uniref:hypothetical protein n=1 Tax=Maricaulis maris TaxID=74318 RepID=UPI0026F0FF20|nr:hypothetical protein [Maricaulis maris]
MMQSFKSACLLIGMGLLGYAGTASAQQAAPPVCGQDVAPYSDFDFVIGEWDFFAADGQQIGTQTYSRREAGCLVVEDWSTFDGGTGTGMTFVDPATGHWRQVWMSPRFHIDYSGGLDETGAMVLEGRLHSNADGSEMQVRGVWAPQEDGSVRQEFWVRPDDRSDWAPLFVGYTRRR